ncbi:MAG: transglutaminase-like cysteine peptidase [Alphaproteobacteria bacterium]
MGQWQRRIRLGWLGAMIALLSMLAPQGLFAESKLSTLFAHTGPVTGPLFGDEVPPTVGAALWCGSDPREVFCRGAEVYKPLHLDDALEALISKINLDVNTEIEPVDDIVQWGVPEKWSRPVRGKDGRLQDDCDGYVIEKWYRLVRERGLSKDAFYPLYAEVPGYGGHLVLAVTTDRGTYILDNLKDRIVKLSAFSFTYLKRPRAGHKLDDTWERYLAMG